MTRLAVLLVFGITLTACDARGGTAYTPSDPATLIGTWTEQRSKNTLFATPSATVDLPDFGRVEGAFTVRGALSADLQTVDLARRLPGRPLLRANSGASAGYRPEGAPFVGLTVTGGHVRVTVLYRDGEVSFEAGDVDGPPGFTYADGQLAVRPATLRSDTGAEVRVEGTLAVTTTRLQAGQEFVLSASLPLSYVPGFSDDTTWVFGDRGAFERRIRVDVIFRDETRVEEGSWEILGAERIALALRQGVSRPYTLGGSGSTARLFEESSPQDDATLRGLEDEYYLPVGSLQVARSQQVYTLTR